MAIIENQEKDLTDNVAVTAVDQATIIEKPNNAETVSTKFSENDIDQLSQSYPPLDDLKRTDEAITARVGKFSPLLLGFHGWTSLLMVTMGTLIIVFGCVFAVMISFNEMVAFIVAFASVVAGTFFIGISKLIEAAEIYVLKNSGK